jgi:hypothetical protein
MVQKAQLRAKRSTPKHRTFGQEDGMKSKTQVFALIGGLIGGGAFFLSLNYKEITNVFNFPSDETQQQNDAILATPSAPIEEVKTQIPSRQKKGQMRE